MVELRSGRRVENEEIPSASGARVDTSRGRTLERLEALAPPAPPPPRIRELRNPAKAGAGSIGAGSIGAGDPSYRARKKLMMVEEDREAGVPRAVPAARPTIALPPRSAYESLFLGRPEVSPGPLTLVSSFFAEDPESDCRSFSQLLAGAMASPVGGVAGRAAAESSSASGASHASVPLAAAASSSAAVPVEVAERERAVGGGVRPHRPLGVMVAPSPFFTVPVGLSPACLLESPAPFSPGSFGLTHQQVLAQVTAQAMQAAQAHIQIQAEYPSDTSGTAATSMQPARSSVNSAFPQQTQNLTSDAMATTSEPADGSHSEQTSQAVSMFDKPNDDGYNWRKYGQKQVKSCEYPRSYYKCTHPDCPVKKKVERSFDGQVTEIIYKGQHNHPKPPPNKRSRDGPSMLGGSSDLNGNLDVPENSETCSQGQIASLNGAREHIASGQISRRDQEFGQPTAEHLSGSSDGEEVGGAEVKTEEGDDSEHDLKRRKMDVTVIESSSSHRTVTEPRIIVQTTSEVDLLDDGYRWRKYGQKVVKGNPYPRSYYKCTNAGCNVRKHVERASTDPKAVITTYEGKHNHDVPAARNSSHNTASASSVISATRPKVQNLTNNRNLHEITDFRSNSQQPAAVLQLKEEYEVA
ncbi:hypothetical protein Taro_033112 [Colocasia esculenta]|uniref:WRKY domain-containing protein n=1 Tax=Colocasia esculenta TaxID=4460 RepID=A0A843W3V2_COLES|nr:hypothetical protein [Colocasia esculenta]